VILAVNKIDDKRAKDRSLEFYRFGFDPVVEVAAEHGQGIGDLLDEIVKRIRAVPKRAPEQFEGHEALRGAETCVAIVGRPNVGKSSLVNRLLREQRMLVSELPAPRATPSIPSSAGTAGPSASSTPPASGAPDAWPAAGRSRT